MSAKKKLFLYEKRAPLGEEFPGGVIFGFLFCNRAPGFLALIEDPRSGIDLPRIRCNYDFFFEIELLGSFLSFAGRSRVWNRFVKDSLQP